MTLPRFFDRVADAHVPLLGGGAKEEFAARLNSTVVKLAWSEGTPPTPAHRAGFLLAANLLARLYPRISIEAQGDLARSARDLIKAINPGVAIVADTEAVDAGILWGSGSGDPREVGVAVEGWNVHIDPTGVRSGIAAVAAATLAAAALSAGELFRTVFAAHIGRRARTEKQAGVLNLVTLADEPADLAPLEECVDVGDVYLVGAGAVGQAAVEVIRHTSLAGRLFVVDPETVELSNLQRYVLTTDADVGAVKADMVVRALSGGRVVVEPVKTHWGGDERTMLQAYSVLCAVDTAEARVALQSGLPGCIYNAWTQPQDVGWSRHEDFGGEPCLACLYWPDRPRPSTTSLIASALGQNERRVATYMALGIPVGRPLPGKAIRPAWGQSLPPDAGEWAARPILDDVAVWFGLAGRDKECWRELRVEQLYHEGICGGGIVRALTSPGTEKMLVPMAHQSALAGTMLATQLIVGRSARLRGARPSATEGRFNVLAGFPQRAQYARARTAGCLCADTDFLTAYRSRWLQSH